MGGSDGSEAEVKVGRAVIGTVSAVFGVASLLFTLLFLGFIAPVTREHCAMVSPDGLFQPESGWHFTLAIPPADDAPDGEQYCIRNSVSREALGVTGIWPLGSPVEQMQAAVASDVRDVAGDSTASYVEASFDLQEETQAETQAATAALKGATTPEELAVGVTQVRDVSQVALDRLESLVPPDELREFHATAIAVNSDVVEASNRLLPALDGPNPDAAVAPFREFINSLKEARQEFRSAQSQFAEALDG